VRVTSHFANATLEDGEVVALLFINVTNLGARDIEITHAWVGTSPPLCFDNPERPLPRRLSDQECWSTWVVLASVQPGVSVREDLARVRLSTGTVLSAVKETTMPPMGSVAGGRAQMATLKKVG
jgi:hypothetical protein